MSNPHGEAASPTCRECGDRARSSAAEVFHEWNRRSRARDRAGLLSLYADQAVLDLPLMPPLPTGTNGHDLDPTTSTNNTERALSLTYPATPFVTDGETLFWEREHITVQGVRVSIAEVMRIEAGQIAAHRTYWGWFGMGLPVSKALTSGKI